MLVFVFNNEPDRCAGGYALEYSRQDTHTVFLVAGSDNCRLARTAAVEFKLHGIKVDSDSGGHSVDYATYCGSMRFTERGEAKYVSKRIFHLFFL